MVGEGDNEWYFDIIANWTEHAGETLCYRVQASDIAGNIFTSAEDTILIERKPSPVVDIISRYNQWESGIVVIEAEATDPDGIIQEVLFQCSIDGETWYDVGTVLTPPYSVDWDTRSMIPTVDDSVWVKAVATNDDGLTGQDVIDRGFGVDNEPPTANDDYDDS